MIKRSLVFAVLMVAFLMVGTSVEASGRVTFEIEITSGCSLLSPGDLTFPPVGPGQTVQQDLEITVFSNTNWSLEMEVRDLGEGDALLDAVQLRYDGKWQNLPTEKTSISEEQPPTGQNGLVVRVPFRLQGGYEHNPGSYSFEVEFTVVPAL